MNAMVRKSIAAYAVTNSNLPPLIAVVRLYERALLHIRLAREAILARRFDEHWRQSERAIAIFSGLDSILDMAKGGEIAQELRRFYRIIIIRLGSVAARRDAVRAIDVVLAQVTVMTHTWRDIADQR